MTVRKWYQVFRYEYEQTAENMQMQGSSKNQNYFEMHVRGCYIVEGPLHSCQGGESFRSDTAIVVPREWRRKGAQSADYCAHSMWLAVRGSGGMLPPPNYTFWACFWGNWTNARETRKDFYLFSGQETLSLHPGNTAGKIRNPFCVLCKISDGTSLHGCFFVPFF